MSAAPATQPPAPLSRLVAIEQPRTKQEQLDPENTDNPKKNQRLALWHPPLRRVTNTQAPVLICVHLRSFADQSSLLTDGARPELLQPDTTP